MTSEGSVATAGDSNCEALACRVIWVVGNAASLAEDSETGLAGFLITAQHETNQYRSGCQNSCFHHSTSVSRRW